MWRDPIVEEIKKIREEHAASFDYDIDRIFADIREQQRASGKEYISLPPKRLPEKKAG